MSVVLVATGMGCMEFEDAGERKLEFEGLQVCSLAIEPGGTCLTVVNGNEIWRRGENAQWSQVLKINDGLAAITSVDGKIFAATLEPALLCISESGEVER